MSKRFWKNLGIGLVLILVIFNIFVFKFLQAYITDRGEGNLALKVSGLYVNRMVYQKNGQTVMLIGMIHIADDAFFKDIVSSVPEENSIVLLEGVDDDERISGQALDYSSLARWLGTSYQDKSFDADIKKRHRYEYADVSAADLSPESRRFLELLAREDNFQKRFDTLMDEDFDQEDWDRAEASFQSDRNRKLLQTFDSVSSKYSTIAIPWGVTHLDDFASAMETRGYTRVESRMWKAINFWF